jgi:DNA invertase Pin-like site-specific DNA recombinase
MQQLKVTIWKSDVCRYPPAFALLPGQNPAYSVRKTLSFYNTIQIQCKESFSDMLIGYMRVSSDNDRQTTDLQRDALLAAGVDPRHLFEDKASGARDDRQGLKQALEYVCAGDCLVVWKLDRLGRSLPHLLQIVTDLHKRGIAFRSLTEQMDTTTPHGELLFGIFGSLAQYERALARERIMAGLEAARKRGRKGGRPKAISEEKLEAIREAIQAGSSKASICRTFGVKRSTLYDTLDRATISTVLHSPKPASGKSRKSSIGKQKPATSPTSKE